MKALSVALLFVAGGFFYAGCSEPEVMQDAPPPGACGWQPPTAEDRERLFHGEGETLREQAPELFE